MNNKLPNILTPYFNNSVKKIGTLENYIRKLYNGDTFSKAYVMSIIKNGRKFTQNQVKNELVKLDLRRDLLALGVSKNMFSTNTNSKQLVSMLQNKLVLVGLIKTKQGTPTHKTLVERLKEDLGITNNSKTKIIELIKENNFKKKVLKRTNHFETLLKNLEKNHSGKTEIEKIKILLSKLKELSIIDNIDKMLMVVKSNDPELIKYFYNFFERKIMVTIGALGKYAKNKQDNNLKKTLNEMKSNYTKFRNMSNNIDNVNKNIIQPIEHKREFLQLFITLYQKLTREYLKIKKYMSKDATIEKMKENRAAHYNKPKTVLKNITNKKNEGPGLPSSLMYKKNKNGYITNSGNNNSTKLNINSIQVAKGYNLTQPFVKIIKSKESQSKRQKTSEPLENINRNTNLNINNLEELSALVWLDQAHDFGKNFINIKNTETLLYKITGQNGKNHIKDSKLVEKLKNHRIIDIIDNDLKLIDNFELKLFSELEDILEINHNRVNTISYRSLRERLSHNEINSFSIDARNSTRNVINKLRLNNKKNYNKLKMYIPLSSYIDPGKQYLEKKHFMKNLTSSKDIGKIHFDPNPIGYKYNGRVVISYISHLNNNTKRRIVKLKIGNDNQLPIGLSKNKARSNGNYKAYLSKTFGDLMHILDIASITNKKVFFVTFDRTAAFIYAYVRKFIFNRNDINLIAMQDDLVKLIN